jgi:hypothetical protein
MALLAVVSEFVAAAFGHEAKPATLADSTVNEVGANAAAVVAEAPAPKLGVASVVNKAAKIKNFSMSPLEMRIIAHVPYFRVIGLCEADSRQMASLADANERQLLFVKITLG